MQALPPQTPGVLLICFAMSSSMPGTLVYSRLIMTQQRDCANSLSPLGFRKLQTPDQSTPSPVAGCAEVDSSCWFVIRHFYRGEREILGLGTAAARSRHRCATRSEAPETRTLTKGRTAWTDQNGKAREGKYALIPNPEKLTLGETRTPDTLLRTKWVNVFSRFSGSFSECRYCAIVKPYQLSVVFRRRISIADFPVLCRAQIGSY
jgi:hypothetical protein